MAAPTGTADAAPAVAEAHARPSGARSGALLGAASAVSIAVNYAFLLASGRLLGSDGYGSLAALLGLLAVVLMPAGALQLAVSREVSRLRAGGDTAEADRFARATLRLAAIATGPLLAVALVFALPLNALLNIDSVGLVLLAESTLVTAFVSPVAMGVLQGNERFHALASLIVYPLVLRLGLLAVVAAAGLHLGGIIFVNLVASVAGTVTAVELIRSPRARSDTAPRPDLRPFLRYLGPVAAGIVGIALLTHIDILVVKARFAADEAGAYGAASAFARVAFFLPATILAVLFPRTAARQARGEETEDILGRSLLATAVFCSGLALFYAATGEGLVVTTFGADFAAGGRVLAPFALAIGLFSMANVLVGYHLSRGERRYAWIVVAGVGVQMVVLALIPTSLRTVVWADVAVGVGLLAAHELLVGSSVPALRAGVGHFSAAAGVRFRRLAAEGLVVVSAASAFVCVLFWPVVRHLGSTIIGKPGSDSTGSVFWFWQLKQEGGFHLLGTTHHTLSGAPFGWDEGNGLNVQWLLPYYPGYLATKLFGEITAYNLVTLSGYVLSGAAMYLLARYLGCARLVSAWAGLAYMVFPWHLARVEHASLVHVEVLPLLLLALVAAARRPGWIRFGFVGAATLACWFTSGYYGAIALVTTGAFAVGAALVSSRRVGLRIVVGSMVCALVATGLVGVASTTSGVGTGAGLQRAPEDLSSLGLRPLELVVPAAGNFVVGDWARSVRETRMHGSNATETTNYLGLLTIALALAWLVLAWRRRRGLTQSLRSATAGLGAALAVGFLFALPSPITVLGHDVWMPSRLLWEFVPAFRVPSHWEPALMAATVALAALGLQEVWRAFSRRRLELGAVLVGAAMVFSFLELAISPTRARFRTGPVPAEYGAVARTPRGVLAEYPLGTSDIYRLWQRRHGRPLLNGAKAETPADDARRVLQDPAAPGTAEALALLGVSAIVIHPHAIVDVDVAPRVPPAAGGYRLVGRFPDGASLWQVVARPAPALVTLPGGFTQPTEGRDGALAFALASPAGVGTLELTATTPGLVRLSFEAVPPSGKRSVLRVADPGHEQSFTLYRRTRISVLVQVPRGRSRLLVKVDPPPTSGGDAVVLSGVRAERSSGGPALHAEPISPKPF